MKSSKRIAQKHTKTLVQAPTRLRRQSTAKFLQSLSENALQVQVIEPLLRKLGFSSVYHNSGKFEKGKDMVAIRPDEFGNNVFCGIQVKKTRVIGKVDDPKSLAKIMPQLRQLAIEEVFDPSTNSRRVPDRVFFFSPFPINNQVFDASAREVGELRRNGIELVCGDKLVELVENHLSDLIPTLEMEDRYRIQLRHQLKSVAESSAFGIHYELNYSAIYVDMGLSLGRGAFDPFIHVPVEGAPPIEIPTTAVEAAKFRAFKSELIGSAWWTARTEWVEVSRRKAKGGGAETKIEPKRVQKHLVTIDLYGAIRPIMQAADSLRVRLQLFASPSASKELREAIANECVQLTSEVQRLLSMPGVGRLWRLAPERLDNALAVAVHSSELIDLDQPLLVLGGPGAGKTTLLRVACSRRLDSPTVPIFIPLAELKVRSYDELLRRCLAEASKTGIAKSISDIEQLLSSRRICLFLDGLDELGKDASKFMGVVNEVDRRCPGSVVIVSCRNTFDVPRRFKCLYVTLQPFTRTQLNMFVDGWFRAAPTKASALKRWLDKNSSMSDDARVPLVAALLCALHESRAEMPSTEAQLYENRFRLLLGEWERAKGIAPLPEDLRSRYLHYLSRLAFEVHSRGERAFERSDALQLARKYHDKSVHRVASELVDDCIRRGVLLPSSDGRLNFGHLTCQEFLAARWLTIDGERIWEAIGPPWWAKVVQFYAAIKKDLSPLIRTAMRRDVVSRELLDLLPFAPLTDDALVRSYARRVDVVQSLFPKMPENLVFDENS